MGRRLRKSEKMGVIGFPFCFRGLSQLKLKRAGRFSLILLSVWCGMAFVYLPCAFARQSILSLFQREIQQAPEGVQWRGEPLSDATRYALAVMGLSWNPVWGQNHLYWMGWARCLHKDLIDRRNKQVAEELTKIRVAYANQDWGYVVDEAYRYFPSSAIDCNPELKLEVGNSFLHLHRPERAYPVFASAYQAERLGRGEAPILATTDWQIRRGAYEAAKANRMTKEAVVFGLSLLFQPSPEEPVLNEGVLAYLVQQGVELNQITLGILQAPPGLKGLPAYSYVAADILAMSPSPDLLPVFMALEQSGDVYLRSRAIIGLAALAYRPAMPQTDDGWEADLPFHPQVTGLSADQRAQISQMVMQAAHDGNYRLRAAAAFALGLLGGEESRNTLLKMEKDPACFRIPTDVRGTEELRFPVREAVAIALSRWGIHFDSGDGTYSGKELAMARRGTRDVTHDWSGINRRMVSALKIFSFDTPPPLTVMP